MTIHYQGHGVTLHHGDCLDVLRTLPDASVDSVCTDPPYGLEFMGKDWDKFGGTIEPSTDTRNRDGNWTTPPFGGGGQRVRFGAAPGLPFQRWCELWTAECLRVLKPGGHLLAFGGTRTWHRLACAVEDAGFEVRDSIAWMHGQGFPKSLDVSKAIDKAAGAKREVVGRYQPPNGKAWNLANDEARASIGPVGHSDRAASLAVTAPATPDAERWQGWGTALKPAFEPVVVARKPLIGTVAANVLAHGTGALNIDGCRVGMSDADRDRLTEWHAKYGGTKYADGDTYAKGMGDIQPPHAKGRWPANVVLDESQAEALDEQSGERPGFATQNFDGTTAGKAEGWGNIGAIGGERREGFNDTGGASRFFYVAKADATERPRVNGTAHPTVKPLSLMRWLVRLVTPPGGTVLEPFAGSGTTVEACIIEGFDCIAIEKGDEYLPLIMQRINRRRDPVAAIRQTGDELGLFELDGEGA